MEVNYLALETSNWKIINMLLIFWKKITALSSVKKERGSRSSNVFNYEYKMLMLLTIKGRIDEQKEKH